MNLVILIIGPIIGAVLLVGAAFLFARLVKGPAEIIAESSELTKSENNSLFPRWIAWLYVVVLLGFLSLHFLINRSFEPPDPNWPLFATTAVVGFAGLVHSLRMLPSTEPGRFRRVSVMMAVVFASMVIFSSIILFLVSKHPKREPNTPAMASPMPLRVD